MRELSNRDKHRRLNLLARRANVRFLGDDGTPLYVSHAPTARIDESVSSSFTVFLARDQLEGGVYLEPSYEVVFDEPPVAIAAVVGTLEQIHAYVGQRVVPAIKALL